MGTYKTTEVTALVVSAGSGRRMGRGGKKQFLFLEDKPLIAHTLSSLSAYGGIDSIILVVPEADIAYCEREIVGRFGFKKVKCILSGGKERQDSVRIGLSAVDDSEFVLIHDGVRPFVTEKIIDRVLTAAFRYGAATTAILVRDTVKKVSAHGWVEGTLAREGLWLVQTPQVFRTDCIKEAHRRAFEEGVSFTDDSGLLEWLGMPVAVVEGSLENIKITTKEDLELAKAILLMQRSKMK